MNNSLEEKFAANQLLWDARVAGHMASTFYDVPSFLAGKCSLMTAELAAMGEVKDKTLLHLQCHFGMDTLSWARRGAKVTGMDISTAAINQAQELAAQLEIDASFVACSVYDLPQHLDGKFDIVFTSYGALIWLPDLQQWADIVARYLKPGGRLCIAEFHPSWYSLDWDTYKITYPYFNTGEAFEETPSTSYAGAAEGDGVKEYFWCHSLSEIIQPLIDRGLQIDHFKEYPFSSYDAFQNLKEVRPGEWIPETMPEGHVPMMFGLGGNWAPR